MPAATAGHECRLRATPAAYDDLDGIWEFIAEHNLDAADRVIADIRTAIINLVALLACAIAATT